MPKRRLQDDANDLRKKLRRLEREIQRAGSDDGSVDVEADDDVDAEREMECFESDGEESLGQQDPDMDSDGPLSDNDSVLMPYQPNQGKDKEPQAEADAPPLPTEIIEALGEAKTKETVHGPKINEEISKRWGRIILDGLGREQRQKLIEKTLIPENFTLVKAPALNSEIAAAITDSARTRDKNLEKAQSHLGVAIAAIANLVSTLVEKDMPKMDIIRHLSEANQLLLDLHHLDTDNRRKLATYSIDKRFLSLIKDAKRDDFLFGEKLGDKIKASKTAEKSGLQIKRTGDRSHNASSSSTLKRGNGRQPRSQSQRGRGSGNRGRGAAGTASSKQQRYQQQSSKDKPAPK